MARCILIVLTVLTVVFAYLLYEPLPPEDFRQPWRLRTELGVLRLFDLVTKIAGFFGYEYPQFSRAMGDTLIAYAPINVDESVRHRDTDFNGVPVRIYEPVTREKDGRGVVYYHGGGFIVGNLDSYRLAPEHVFPAAVEDSETATKFFLQHATDYGVDPNRVAVMGDSAGGNLATVISRRLSTERFTPLPKLQALIYPSTQKLNNDLPSFRHNQYGPIATKEQDSDFTSWYLFGHLQYRSIIFNNSHVSSEFRESIKHIMDVSLLPDDKLTMHYQAGQYHDANIWKDVKDKFQNPDLSPLLADVEDLKDVPPVYIVTCQYDILRDEELLYIHRLRTAGVEVTHDHLTVCFHGWTFFHENSFSKDYSDMITKVRHLL